MSPVNPHDMQATPPTELFTRHEGVLSVCMPQEIVCQPCLGVGSFHPMCFNTAHRSPCL